MAQRLNLSCPSCPFAATVVEGTPAPAQVMTDLNEDFYDFRLFACSSCQDIVPLDVFDRSAALRCPRCRRDVFAVDPQALHCPRCHASLRAESLGE